MVLLLNSQVYSILMRDEICAYFEIVSPTAVVTEFGGFFHFPWGTLYHLTDLSSSVC